MLSICVSGFEPIQNTIVFPLFLAGEDLSLSLSLEKGAYGRVYESYESLDTSTFVEISGVFDVYTWSVVLEDALRPNFFSLRHSRLPESHLDHHQVGKKVKKHFTVRNLNAFSFLANDKTQT